MEIKDRLKTQRINLNMTLEDVAKQVGVTRATIQKYENGIISNIPSDKIEAIAKALKTTPAFLMGWTEKASSSDAEISFNDFTHPEINVIKKYRVLDVHGKDMVDTVLDKEYARAVHTENSVKDDYNSEENNIKYIRHYFVPAAAGYASPIEGEDFELIVKDDSVPDAADFCIDIQGDSMEPYIKDGQRVYVQRDTTLTDFDVGVFFVDGNVYCKQYCIDHVGNLHLLSANPKREDANKTILATSGSTVLCYGKVILKKKLPEPYYE